MTITYLHVPNISGENLETVWEVLNQAGYQAISIKKNEITLGWSRLSRDDLNRIKSELERNGFDLNSVCQTSWLSRPVGLDML